MGRVSVCRCEGQGGVALIDDPAVWDSVSDAAVTAAAAAAAEAEAEAAAATHSSTAADIPVTQH